MNQPQETATPATEEPTGSAPVAGDTQAGATAEDTQAGGQPTEAAPSQTDEEAPEGFSSATWNALPQPQRKELNRYFTQRTQKLSAREKEIEQTLSALNAALQQNAPAVPAGPSPDEVAIQQIEQVYGPEVAKALDQFVQSRVAPVRAELDRERAETHAKALKDVYEGFMRETPGAKELEPVMTEIAQTFRPNGMPMREYFSNLHTLALMKEGRLEAEITKKVTERITNSARAAEPPSSGVSPSKVAVNPPSYSKMSMKEAIHAAAQEVREGR